MVALLTTAGSAMLFSNTEILLPARTGYPQPKLYGHPVQDSLPAQRRSFLQEWQRKAEVSERQVEATQQSSAKYYNQHAHPLTEIGIGSNVAIQNPRKNLWDTYGIITAISPNRKYSIKISSGRVFPQNLRFLRRRVPMSMPTCMSPHLLVDKTARDLPVDKTARDLPADQTARDTPANQTTQELRRSARARQPSNRLVEDPTWH